MIARFYDGLQHEIKELLVPYDRPTKLSDMIELTTRLGRRLEQLQLQNVSRLSDYLILQDLDWSPKQQLECLRQQGSIESYTSRFQKLAERFNGHDVVLVSYLYDGLKPDIKSTLERADLSMELHEALKIVLSVGRRLEERKK